MFEIIKTIWMRCFSIFEFSDDYFRICENYMPRWCGYFLIVITIIGGIIIFRCILTQIIHIINNIMIDINRAAVKRRHKGE